MQISRADCCNIQCQPCLEHVLHVQLHQFSLAVLQEGQTHLEDDLTTLRGGRGGQREVIEDDGGSSGGDRRDQCIHLD